MRSALFLAAVLAAGCQHTQVKPSAPPPPIRSLTGRELPPLPIDPARRAQLESDLADALAGYNRAPTEDNTIWLGRRFAYLGDYSSAIATFSKGIAKYPQSYKLLRHRGHRFITTRQLDRAIADLSRAAALAASHPDEIEPDGAPNKLNQPRSTSHSNIYYHLALAHYLKGDFAAALPEWQQCLTYSRINDDMLVAATYWLHLTLRRLGRESEAAAVLEPIRPNMDIIENDSYHRLLLMFRGELRTDDLLKAKPAESTLPAGVDDATIAYGLGAWHWCSGEKDQARALWQQTTSAGNWAAFGYIAAESELARMGPGASAPPNASEAVARAHH